MEDKMEQNIEILNFEEIVKQYNLTASEVLRFLNLKGCPTLPRKKGQPYKIIKSRWEEWLMRQ
jgi:hypothetical protein